jgi:hypothetical protein
MTSRDYSDVARLIAGLEEAKLRTQPPNALDREAEYLDDLAQARRQRWARRVRGFWAHLKAPFGGGT